MIEEGWGKTRKRGSKKLKVREEGSEGVNRLLNKEAIKL